MTKGKKTCSLGHLRAFVINRLITHGVKLYILTLTAFLGGKKIEEKVKRIKKVEKCEGRSVGFRARLK